MSEPTTTTTTAQAPETAAQQAPVPADVQKATEAAQLAAAVELAEKRKAANATLELCVVSFQTGERAMRAGRLESGRLADEYLRQRMALGDKRDAAVQTVEGELAKWASDKVDANALIRVYHAHRLLAVEPGIADQAANMGYGHYREAWCQLVERMHKDSPQECYVLLPATEAECRTLFATSAANGLSLQACKEAVYGLHKQYATKQASEKASAEEKAKATAEEQRAAAKKAAEDAKAAKLLADAAKRAADKAADEKRAELTAVAEKAKAELLAKQRAAVEANAKANVAEKAAKQAAAEKAAAEKAAEKADAKTEPRAPRTTRQTTTSAAAADADSGKMPVHNPIAAAKQSTVKDLAESLVKQLEAHEKPRQVLEEFARLMRWSEKDGVAMARGMLNPESRGAQQAALAFCLYVQKHLRSQEGTTEAPAAQSEAA